MNSASNPSACSRSFTEESPASYDDDSEDFIPSTSLVGGGHDGKRQRWRTCLRGRNPSSEQPPNLLRLATTFESLQDQHPQISSLIRHFMHENDVSLDIGCKDSNFQLKNLQMRREKPKQSNRTSKAMGSNLQKFQRISKQMIYSSYRCSDCSISRTT
ncbi:hypothetical protein SCHPADRAFT_562164 [Schizopora paradoxa]|uniref:Uncharacterized protein n=1 Tax=Schizopora paradoxa TaxID=27342 RepID=A0A0H2RXQ1_9AGAM|nr:hypothetical protein SCHPADRAFT_562164 [Schizopora paradoxa]